MSFRWNRSRFLRNLDIEKLPTTRVSATVSATSKEGVTMDYPFKNLVFQEGGTKGLAYLGALDVLHQKEIIKNIQRVGGASAGSVYTLLVALGYSIQEMKGIIQSLELGKFLDETWGAMFDVNRPVNEFGWYKGDNLRRWIGELVKQKTGNTESTFKEIYDTGHARKFINPYFATTNLSTGFAELLSYEHTPRLPVADAVRLAMSFPFIFAAKQNIRGDYYSDGTVVGNSLVKMFDREKYIAAYDRPAHGVMKKYYAEYNEMLKADGKTLSPYIHNTETLGFRLGTARHVTSFRDQGEYPTNKIEHFFAFTWSVVEHYIEQQAHSHLHHDDWERTVFIDTKETKTMQFNVDEKMAEELMEAGRDYTNRYFDWYENKDKPSAESGPAEQFTPPPELT